jgi:outer membrane protein OmpU
MIATDSFGQTATISFSGSGELDNGMTVSYVSKQLVSFITSQAVHLIWVTWVQYLVASQTSWYWYNSDMVPNAGEQPWDDLGTNSRYT